MPCASLFTEHLFVGVGMRIDVDQPDRAMPTGDGAQHRQRQRVVAAERQRMQPCARISR